MAGNGKYEGPEVVDLGASKRDPASEERVPLFKLDGKTYTIPKNPKAATALRYLYELRHNNGDAAAGQMLEDLLGEESYVALMNSDITMPQLTQVMKAAEQHLMGSIEEPVGNE